MKREMRGLVCALGLALLLPLFLPISAPLADQIPIDEIVGFKADPAPDELLDHYWSMRIDMAWELAGFLTPAWPPTSLFRYLDRLVDHDLGLLDSEQSAMAREYLESEVLLPLAKIAGFEAESARDLRGLDLDSKRYLAEVLYIWTRDGVAFSDMSLGKVAIALVSFLLGGGWLSAAWIPVLDPLATPLDPVFQIFQFFFKLYAQTDIFDRLTRTDMNVMDVIPLLFFMKSPVEAASYGNSNCVGKALLLASLLEMIGLNVGLGFIGAQVLYTRFPWLVDFIPEQIQYIPAIGHTFVMLKDPGWGIGRWIVAPGEDVIFEEGGIQYGALPEKDMMGKNITGAYLMLDPTYSALFNPLFPPLEFDQNFPEWLELNPNELAFGLLS
jgi:hypothetical protein